MTRSSASARSPQPIIVTKRPKKNCSALIKPWPKWEQTAKTPSQKLPPHHNACLCLSLSEKSVIYFKVITYSRVFLHETPFLFYSMPIQALSKVIHGLSKPIQALSKSIQALSKPIQGLSKSIQTLSKPIQELSKAIQGLSK